MACNKRTHKLLLMACNKRSHKLLDF
jgi:hypothetical protein